MVVRGYSLWMPLLSRGLSSLLCFVLSFFFFLLSFLLFYTGKSKFKRSRNQHNSPIPCHVFAISLLRPLFPCFPLCICLLQINRRAAGRKDLINSNQREIFFPQRYTANLSQKRHISYLVCSPVKWVPVFPSLNHSQVGAHGRSPQSVTPIRQREW